MPTIEPYFARQSRKVQTLPRANARQLSDTGQGLEAQALSEVGGALTDTSAILSKWYEREGNSEYDTLRGLYQSEIGKVERTQYKDSAELEAGFKKLESDLKSLPTTSGLKNKSGLRKYAAYLELNKASREKISGEKEIRMIKLNAEANLYTNVKNAIENRDRKAIGLLFQGGVDDNIITPKGAEQAKDQAFHDLEWDTGIQWSEDNPDYLLEQLETAPDDYYPALDPAERLRLKNMAESKIDSIRIQASKNRLQVEGETRKQLTDWMLSGELTQSALESVRANTSAVDYENYAEYLLRRKTQTIKEAEKAEAKSQDEESVKKRWGIIRDLPTQIREVREGDLNPIDVMKQLDELALLGNQGKTDAEQYLAKLTDAIEHVDDLDDPLKRPAYTNELKNIEETFDALISYNNKYGAGYDVYDEIADLKRKNRIKTDLDAWAIKNPDATDEQIEKKADALMKDIKEETVQGLFSRLWMTWKESPFGFLYRKVAGEELSEPKTQSEWEAEVARLKAEAIEQARDYYDEWKGKW